MRRRIVADMAAECVIGVDLGGTKLLAGAVGHDLGVHHRALRPAAGLDQRQLVESLVEAVEETRAAAGRDIAAVGFGIPCLIDQARGMALMAVNLPIADLPFRDVMAERLGLPVFIDNDANVAALAEHRFGAARGARHAVVLTVGTGIGGGLVLDGRIYRGAVGAGAELGHTVIDLDGPLCQGNCPNRGCLEAVASGSALGREAERLADERPDSAFARARNSGREVTGVMVTELAHDGDAEAREALEIVGRRLGVGIANFVNLFNPEVVVIGGGVVAAGDLLLGPARDEMAKRALPSLVELVRIVPARFAHEAGMVGAAALAFDALERAGNPP
jgi:glucokinase